MDAAWLSSAGGKYGGSLARPAPVDHSGEHLAAVAGPAEGDRVHPLVSVHSPLMWLAVLAAATVGLASYSTSVKAGPVSASVKVG